MELVNKKAIALSKKCGYFVKRGLVCPILTYKGMVVGGSAFVKYGVDVDKVGTKELSDKEYSFLSGLQLATHYAGKAGHDAEKYDDFKLLSIMAVPTRWWAYDKTQVGACKQSFLSAKSGKGNWKEIYLKHLRGLSALEVAKGYGSKAILYCVEFHPDTCHRDLLAKWMCINLDLPIPEINYDAGWRSWDLISPTVVLRECFKEIPPQ